MPLGSYDPIRVLGLDQYPGLMAALSPRTHADMAVKVVTTLLAQGTQVKGEGAERGGGEGDTSVCVCVWGGGADRWSGQVKGRGTQVKGW
jgi:hypothetical protein